MPQAAVTAEQTSAVPEVSFQKFESAQLFVNCEFVEDVHVTSVGKAALVTVVQAVTALEKATSMKKPFPAVQQATLSAALQAADPSPHVMASAPVLACEEYIIWSEMK